MWEDFNNILYDGSGDYDGLRKAVQEPTHGRSQDSLALLGDPKYSFDVQYGKELSEGETAVTQ